MFFDLGGETRAELSPRATVTTQAALARCECFSTAQHGEVKEAVYLDDVLEVC